MSTTLPPHSSSHGSRTRKRAAPPTVHWQRAVPDAIASLSALANPDYADIVTASVGGNVREKTPQEWAEAALGGVPRALLLVVPAIQRAVLGLRLQLRPSPDHLLGWKIAERGENWIRIEAASWFMTGRVVMHGDDGQLSFASFIRYDRPLAAVVWPPVSLIHRQVALALVRSAVRAQ